ncbi:MAG: secretin N-terminal domain-containing protein [Candidatus Wallbacteria bacterium]|nr:secretin N-terminal domain-containing protein [Candidatus Wallbacteria bacterium]
MRCSLILLLILFTMAAAGINDPVPQSHYSYKILEGLKTENLLGEKGDLYQPGITLTRREVASLLAVSLSNLESMTREQVSTVSTELLEGLQKLTQEFSEELELLYSFGIDSLTRKITFLERAITDSKQGTSLEKPLKAAPMPQLQSPSTIELMTELPNAVPEKPALLMKFDPNDPVLNQKVSLNFVRTELPQVLTALFQDTTYSLVTGVDVKGKINIQVEDKTIIEILKSLAEANKFDFQIEQKIVTVIPISREVTEIIKLNFAEASEVVLLLDAFKGRTGSVKIDKRTKSILVTDAIENIRKMQKLIAEIDIESDKTRKILHVFSFKYVDPKDIESILTTLKSQEGILQVNSQNSTSIVIDYQENIDKIAEYIKKLDLPAESKQLQTEIYNVRYAKAVDIVSILQSDVFKKHDEYSKLQISSDARTNSLIISGKPADILSLKKYIKRLDARNRQVVITAKIIEVTLDDKHSEGVNWTKLVPKNNTNKALDQENTMKTLLFPEASNNFTFSFKFGTLDNEQFTSLLNALKTISNIKVVSNPTITTLDNVESKILIGEKIPFEETTTTSTGTTSKVTFKDVGITLTVTPTISSDNYVTLKVHPEISQQNGVVQSTGEPIIGTTEADTQVLVRNGDTMVIGGLVKETKSHVENKLPLLGDIPGIGRLFTFNSMTKNRVETIIFITPTIMDYEEGNPYEISEYFE